ncbi:MAG TPA: amidohydrolase [Candidatus Limnocylindrales bacterium]|nr:amidohydrolase [Candidatus Limnocylindrales bacterium]
MNTVVYENARVYTMDPQAPTAEAIAVRGERIVAVGEVAACREAAGADARREDLARMTVLPGLCDTHIHSANYARGLRQVDLRDATSLAECLELIRAKADGSPGWLLGGRWNFNRWDEARQPTRHDLDSVCPDRPAALPSVDGHTVWVNSLALQRLDYTEGTPDPAGGQIVRDSQGVPNGILRETAAHPLRALVEAESVDDLAPQLKAAQARLLAVGLTGVHDIDGEDCRRAFETLYAQGDLALRVHKLIALTALDDAIEGGRSTGDGDSWLSTGPVKIFADGALGSHTCLVTQAFAGEPDNHGIAILTADDVDRIVRKACLAGIAVAAHAIGDAANAMMLQALRRWKSTGLAPHLRHRIEHAQHQRPADIAAFAELGVIASMQPVHCTSDIHLVQTLLAGHDIASYPWKSLLNNGATLTFGSDAPVEDPNPFHGIHAAVTRQRADGTPPGGFQPHERVSVAEAIRAYTVTAAYASYEEGRKGMLRPGLLADFIAVTTDPFQAEADQLRDIAVALTVVGGVVRHTL